MSARVAKRIAALAVAVNACAAASASGAQHDGGHDASPPVHSAADIRADLRELYSTLQRAHFDLYAHRSRAEYDRLLSQMLTEIREPESTGRTAIRFQRFVAFGRVAHARVDAASGDYLDYRDAGGNIFPLTLAFREDRAYVVGNRSGEAGIPEGAELLTLDRRPLRSWFERLGRHLSADTPYMTGSLLEYTFPRLLWQEAGERESFSISVRDGRATRRYTIPARRWTDVQASPPAAATLVLDADSRSARMIDGRIAYLRPGPFYDSAADATDPYDTTAFRSFIDESFASFLEQRADALLIDLRDNPGGDNSFSDLMVAWFADRPFAFASAFRIRVSPEAVASNERRLAAASQPDGGVSRRLARAYAGTTPGDVIDFDIGTAQPRAEPRFHGRVYLLVNRTSYSNTVFVAALVQDYGFGTILGEETSDLASTYGAMETFTLPRTGIAVGFPKAQIVRPNGDATTRGVVPDIAIATPVIQGADDPVLQRAIAIVRERDGAR
jgi:hypothetical protein